MGPPQEAMDMLAEAPDVRDSSRGAFPVRAQEGGLAA